MTTIRSDRRFSMISNPNAGAWARTVGTSVLLIVGCALASSGCIMMAGDQLSDIEPRPLKIPPPSIEQTVGDFSFHLDGGKMVTSNKAGRIVNKLILDQWRRRGFITKETYVESSNFTGNADYNLTLSGHQEGDSSVVMQFLSGLTLLILPYSVNTQLDLVYTLEHVNSSKKFEAKAGDSYRMVAELLLLPITPFALGGEMRTYNRLSDHIYDQLAEQGAFDPASWADAPSAEAPARPAVERLRLLDQLRDQGVITGEEYERKKREILTDL
jgi:hypothetical protein